MLLVGAVEVTVEEEDDSSTGNRGAEVSVPIVPTPKSNGAC
jgi:hypothetical protein